MNVSERQAVLGKLFEDALGMAERKGKDYAQQSDILANFKQVADATGLTVFQVWSVYFMKHVISVVRAIRESPTNPSAAMKTEPMRGREVDLVTYVGLLACLEYEYAPTPATVSGGLTPDETTTLGCNGFAVCPGVTLEESMVARRWMDNELVQTALKARPDSDLTPEEENASRGWTGERPEGGEE